MHLLGFILNDIRDLKADPILIIESSLGNLHVAFRDVLTATFAA